MRSKVLEFNYKIIKDPSVKHEDIVDALAEHFSVEVVGDINEESTYSGPTMIIRTNGLDAAAKRCKGSCAEGGCETD